jgi:putative transposase
LDGIIFRLRTGCQWNKLPVEFGDDSTVHRWFQRWNQNGVMKRIWAVMAARCEELDAVFWKWQSADGAMCKARFGGEKDRPKSDGSR